MRPQAAELHTEPAHKEEHMIISRWRGFEIDSSEGYFDVRENLNSEEQGLEILYQLLANPLLMNKIGFALAAKKEATLRSPEEVVLHFDYSRIDEKVRNQVMEAARDIKPRLKSLAREIFMIGRRLNEAKAVLPHGEWQSWLQEEFNLSVRSAQNFMAVDNRLSGKNANFAFLDPSALYLLAAPSTPGPISGISPPIDVTADVVACVPGSRRNSAGIMPGPTTCRIWLMSRMRRSFSIVV